ncbi:hypothetical protein, partial [uncultured Virgibacillus sp.]|uniref:hypothetical protein n=1 Tax=uncultured Virgibacillus sp. TaxID=417355 RepID=UPI002620E699
TNRTFTGSCSHTYPYLFQFIAWSRGLTASYMRDKVKLQSVGFGLIVEPIGHLLAVVPILIHIYFSLSPGVGGLLPVICGITWLSAN